MTSPSTLTEREILGQYVALETSHRHLEDRRAELKTFWNSQDGRRVIFLGSGSGYCLAQASAEAFRHYTGRAAEAFAAGDLLINFSHYQRRLDGAVLVALSRSGSTSEVIEVIRRAKANTDVTVFGIVTREETDLEAEADHCLAMPWAYDTSVCQTATVTTFYSVVLHLCAILANHHGLTEDLRQAIADGPRFMADARARIGAMSGWEDWRNVVLLADGVAWGLADEGAMAFREMTCAPANCYHILDVRHGPMATVSPETLVVWLASPRGTPEQLQLREELNRLGARIVTVGLEADEASEGGRAAIPLPGYAEDAVRGIPFIFVVQWLACRSALARGLNPDSPPNLTAWVRLP